MRKTGFLSRLKARWFEFSYLILIVGIFFLLPLVWLGSDKYADFLPALLIVFSTILLVQIIFLGVKIKSRNAALKSLIAQFKSIQKLTGDLSIQLEYTNQPLLNPIIDEINQLLASWRSVIQQAQEASKEVKHSGYSLLFSVNDARGTIGEMVSHISKVNQNYKSQNQMVMQILEKVRETSQSMGNLNSSINNQLTAVNTSSTDINEIATSVLKVAETAKSTQELCQTLNQVARDGGIALSRSIEAIQQIESASKQITEISGMINSIAGQTNMLAMNAAIEAAHAGEYGAGFAVVADEVRKLAVDSSSSARNIMDIIKTMVRKINNGVKLSNNAGDSLDRIIEDIDSTTNLVNNISNAMKEQEQVAQRVISSMEGMVKLTNQTKDAMSQQQERASTISGVINDLETIGGEVSMLMNELNIGSAQITNAISNVDTIVKNNKVVVDDLETLIKQLKVSKKQSVLPTGVIELEDNISEKEKRRYRRVEKNIGVQINLEDSISFMEHITGETVDISSGGLACTVDKKVDDDAEIQVSLLVPLIKNGVEEEKVIRTNAEVVRNKPIEGMNNMYELGLKFVDMKPDDLALLDNFIKE